MKKFQNWMLLLALAAFCAVPTACSDSDDPAPVVNPDLNDDDENKNPTPTNDYPAIGNARGTAEVIGVDDENNPTVAYVYLELASNSLESINFDDQGAAVSAEGTGVYIALILGISIPADRNLQLPGTYTYNEMGGANSIPEAYYTAVKNDRIVADAAVADGNVTIAAVGDTYKLDFNITLDNGKTVVDSCNLELVASETPDDYSTLTSDITISNLSIAQVLYLGPWSDTAAIADLYAIMLTDGQNDGQSYTGNFMQLMLNVTPGSNTAIPNGTYNTWLDLQKNPNVTVQDIEPFQIMAGYVDDNSASASWYFNDTTEQQVRLQGGEVTVNVEADGTYKIAGAVEDYQGYKINFTYEGTPLFRDASQSSSSVKSIKGSKPAGLAIPSRSLKSVNLGKENILRRNF